MTFEQIRVKTNEKTGLYDITSQVKKIVASSGTENGMCLVYCPHTTAGITINEAADPSVQEDILKELNKVIPFSDGYSHMEGNSAAHIKSSLVGCSETVPIHNGKLVLGTWQGFYFCEFDGPRSRSVYISVSE
ncbi:MAG: secondary thiamine-phosphate synthase enzyme YjbQ [Spirochaetia bacterium]